MKRLPILIATLVVVLTATLAGVALVGLDDERPGMGRTGRMGPMTMGRHAGLDEPSYLVEMVAHHREAVEAARELARSDRAEMRAFGESIVEVQTAQIDQMTTWLAEWYPDEDTDADYQPMMRDLTGLSGDRLDRAFLEDMIGHHMMAVMMSRHLLRGDIPHDELATLAQSIRDDQRAEIVTMRRWLARWFAGD